MTQSCSNCLHWRPREDSGYGECRRYAPRPKTVLGDQPQEAFFAHPETPSSFDCGEWAPQPRGNQDPERLAMKVEVGRLRGVEELLEVVQAELAEQKLLTRELTEAGSGVGCGCLMQPELEGRLCAACVKRFLEVSERAEKC